MHAAQNYIYIVFAVIYIIYSIIKAGKKATKNRPTTAPDPSSQKQDEFKPVQPPTASPLPDLGVDMKKMLEDLLGGGSEEKIPEHQAPRPQPQPLSERPQPVKISTHSPPKEKLITAHTKSFSAKPKITSDKAPFIKYSEISQKVFAEPIIEEESGVDFDIREAIIYSEILKRPQY